MKYLKKKQKDIPFCSNCGWLKDIYSCSTTSTGGYSYFNPLYLKAYICSHPKAKIYAPLSIVTYPPADYKSPKCPLRYINKGDTAE
jgi:hypothetical protein